MNPNYRIIFGRFWKLALISVFFVVVLIIGTPLMTPANTPEMDAILQAPSTEALFGTDELGRDMMTRCLVALSLGIRGASLALLTAGVLAILLGGAAGWWRGTWLDGFISWWIGVLHTVPFLLLIAALGAVLQASWILIYFLAGCVVWATPARLVRAEVMRVRTAKHTVASRAMGFGLGAILVRVVTPTALPSVVISLLMIFPELLILDIGLSFFGVGAQPPTPTLGRLLLDGFNKLHSAPWLSIFPFLTLVLACAALYAVVKLLDSHKPESQDQHSQNAPRIPSR